MSSELNFYLHQEQGQLNLELGMPKGTDLSAKTIIQGKEVLCVYMSNKLMQHWETVKPMIIEQHQRLMQAAELLDQTNKFKKVFLTTSHETLVDRTNELIKHFSKCSPKDQETIRYWCHTSEAHQLYAQRKFNEFTEELSDSNLDYQTFQNLFRKFVEIIEIFSKEQNQKLKDIFATKETKFSNDSFRELEPYLNEAKMGEELLDQFVLEYPRNRSSYTKSQQETINTIVSKLKIGKWFLNELNSIAKESSHEKLLQKLKELENYLKTRTSEFRKVDVIFLTQEINKLNQKFTPVVSTSDVSSNPLSSEELEAENIAQDLCAKIQKASVEDLDLLESYEKEINNPKLNAYYKACVEQTLKEKKIEFCKLLLPKLYKYLKKYKDLQIYKNLHNYQDLQNDKNLKKYKEITITRSQLMTVTASQLMHEYKKLKLFFFKFLPKEDAAKLLSDFENTPEFRTIQQMGIS